MRVEVKNFALVVALLLLVVVVLLEFLEFESKVFVVAFVVPVVVAPVLVEFHSATCPSILVIRLE